MEGVPQRSICPDAAVVLPGLAKCPAGSSWRRQGTRLCGEPPRAREAAETKFQDLVEADIAAAGIPADQFGPFLAFAHEVINRYGRFLTFLHRDDQTAKPRPYNEQLLAAGVAAPYFIWPTLPHSFVIAVSPNQAFRSEAPT
jgi:hypothetical protein